MTATTLLSVALFVAAMAVYPGGTQWDHAARGSDFWQNYLCDLARTVALNGQANPAGSWCAQTALGVLALGLSVFYWLLARALPSHPRLGLAVRILGSFAAVGGVVVAVLPADRFSAMHGVAILVGGVPGLLAGLLGLMGLAVERPAPRLVTGVGVLTLLVSVAAFIPFVRQYFVDGPGPVAAAVLERLALLFLLAWMASMAWHATRERA